MLLAAAVIRQHKFSIMKNWKCNEFCIELNFCGHTTMIDSNPIMNFGCSFEKPHFCINLALSTPISATGTMVDDI